MRDDRLPLLRHILIAAPAADIASGPSGAPELGYPAVRRMDVGWLAAPRRRALPTTGAVHP
jgi:hypothetical protein